MLKQKQDAIIGYLIAKATTQEEKDKLQAIKESQKAEDIPKEK